MKRLLGFYYVNGKRNNVYILKTKGFFYIGGIEKWFLTYETLLDYCENNFENFKLQEENQIK